MGRFGKLSTLVVVGAFGAAAGCSGADEPMSDTSDFTSDIGTLLEFEFEGELETSNTWSLEEAARDQLLYSIGHLNGNRAVGRLDKLVLSDFRTTRLPSGQNQVKYHAKLPVGWGSKSNLPTRYELKMPRRVDSEGFEAFTAKYKGSCAEPGAHDVDSSSFWYYFRPARSGCKLAAEDHVVFDATVTVSPENTTGKYPEYHKVWEDKQLRVVAIFGKYEDGTTTSADAGIAGYDRFVSTVRGAFQGAKTTPVDAPQSPGVKYPDVTVQADLGGGKSVSVTALLVDNVASAGPAFEARYAELSGAADLIFYNGHAGLGQNVRALARKGKFVPGQYQIFFMNGCDTFAYVDGYLAGARAAINPDDPTGTKYMDMVTNVMPSFFSSMPNASMAMIRGLLSYDKPKTYQEIFKEIDSSEVVVVTGEEDNVFQPSGPAPEPWSQTEQGSVERGKSVAFETPELPPGEYVIALREDAANPGGDADLYVRVGKAPTVDAYDQRPWLDGSNEEVRLTLKAKSKVFMMVRGYEQADKPVSAFVLSGRAATK
jgi:hypothetical protein